MGRWVASRHGRIIGIASTSHPAGMRQYVDRVRLPFEFGIDSNGWVARHFGSAVHPMFAIVSPNGIVLVTIPRTPAVINDPRYDPSIEKYTAALEEAVNLPIAAPLR